MKTHNIECYDNQHRSRYIHDVTAKLKRKGAYHHGDLRRGLIDAALKLAAEKGVRAVSLTDAAKSLGVSGAAPYRHFADKEALLAAAAEESFITFRQALRSARTATYDALEGLLRQGEAYVQFGQKYPERLDFMFSMHLEFEKYPGLHQASEAAFHELLDAVEGLVVAKLITAEEVPSTAYQVWFFAHGAATVAMPPSATSTSSQLLRQGVQALLAGKRLLG